MKRFLCLILAAVWLPLTGICEAAEVFPPAEYTFSGRAVRSYTSDTLRYTVEKFKYGGTGCYLSKIWVKDPVRQIVKATADWRKNIMRPVHMAQRIPEAALVINGSGYVSPTYPWIPEDYPGTNADYYYTPLGSLTVTNGEIFRNLEGVAYYGLTLDNDGLQMYIGADNADVLASGPVQTWSFYIQCPLIVGDRSVLAEDWAFADKAARRTVIARINRNNYLILTVTNDGRQGLTVRQVVAFLLENFEMEWAYNLDGGPSSALLVRKKGGKGFKTLFGGTARDEDVMGFRELP